MEFEGISGKVIEIFYRVYNGLGYGFLESVYERAMMHEFVKEGIEFVNQFPIKVYYDGVVVGSFVADFVVEGNLVVELKAVREVSQADENQLLNYLSSTDKEIGLLLNFGEKPEIKRKVYDNVRKKNYRGGLTK
ncbi:MAG: GxxExxY protein [archaeon]